MKRGTRSARAGACAILAFALCVTACGGSSSNNAGGNASATRTTATSKPCPGTPLKFTEIAALSGPLGTAGGDRLKTGVNAAVDGINRTCSLGRPLKVILCDDKTDNNANLACGRTAGSDGSLAILGTVGTFDGGVTASKLPAIFVNGTSAFELTNKNAYSSVNGIALGISATSAIKARGRKSSTLVLPDTPTFQFAGSLIVKMAALLNIKVDSIYFPQDTTDFAPVAAQISQKNDDAVGMLPLNPVVMVNALAQEGITPQNHDIVVPGGVITPEILKQLGSAANGILVVSEALPPTDTSNPGIAAFRADMQADGKNPDDPNVDFSTVTAWSQVKKLEGALLAAGPAVINSLTPQKVVDAVVNHPIDRPEMAPYDFRQNAIPEVPALAGFRVFTRKVAVLQIENGKYNVLSNGFIDILKPPNLASAGSGG
jgi:ABC-type branched-subunit amino acid transport system substrate-binding protein